MAIFGIWHRHIGNGFFAPTVEDGCQGGLRNSPRTPPPGHTKLASGTVWAHRWDVLFRSRVVIARS